MNPVVSVRMGEFAFSSRTDDELAVVGLGSCIALVLIEAVSGTIGVAHVVLPTTSGDGTPPTKYGEQAVPYMVKELKKVLGASVKFGAVLIGGAQMFQTARTMDIGRRNAEAVRHALSDAQIPILAEDTGGTSGRTARAVVHGSVSVKSIGSPARELLSLEQSKFERAIRPATRTPVAATRSSLSATQASLPMSQVSLSATRTALR